MEVLDDPMDPIDLFELVPEELGMRDRPSCWSNLGLGVLKSMTSPTGLAFWLRVRAFCSRSLAAAASESLSTEFFD